MSVPAARAMMTGAKGIARRRMWDASSVNPCKRSANLTRSDMVYAMPNEEDVVRLVDVSSSNVHTWGYEAVRVHFEKCGHQRMWIHVFKV